MKSSQFSCLARQQLLNSSLDFDLCSVLILICIYFEVASNFVHQGFIKNVLLKALVGSYVSNIHAQALTSLVSQHWLKLFILCVQKICRTFKCNCSSNTDKNLSENSSSLQERKKEIEIAATGGHFIVRLVSIDLFLLRLTLCYIARSGIQIQNLSPTTL